MPVRQSHAPAITRAMQARALARQRACGQSCCIICDPRTGRLAIVTEAQAIAAGQAVIDAIFWSIDFSENDLLDPTLLA